MLLSPDLSGNVRFSDEHGSFLKPALERSEGFVASDFPYFEAQHKLFYFPLFFVRDEDRF